MGYVVLFFYPLDFTFVCPTEITAFSDRYSEFAALNTEVLGVSIDSEYCHLAWIQTDRKSGGLGDLEYPLLADKKKEILQAYDVENEDGVALRALSSSTRTAWCSTPPSTTWPSAATWTRPCASCRPCSTCSRTPTRCAPP